MKPRLRLSLLAILFLMSTPALRAAEDPDLDRIEHDYLGAVQSFYPVWSTKMGVYSFDQRFTDYSSRSVKEMVDKLKSLDKRASRISDDRVPPDDRISLKLLQANIAEQLALLDQRKLYRESPYLYVREVVDGLFYLARMEHRTPQERLFPILQRMKAVPGYLETARKTLEKPSPITVQASLKLLDDGMELYRKIAGDFMNKLPERADEILKVSTSAREAMNDFATWLATVEMSETDEFALGKDRYDDMLRNQFFLGYDSDSLLNLAEVLLERYQAEYDDYALFLEEKMQNGRDGVFVPPSFGRSDVMAYYQWEVADSYEETRSHNIVSLPADFAEVTVMETPPYLVIMVPSTQYVPIPPFDSTAHAMIWVRPLPTELDERQLELRYRYVHRRGFRFNAALEAYPGLHTQAEWARANKSDFRRWHSSLMLLDGWHLYCEEMVNRPGFHGDTDPAHWLGYLDELRQRAALVTCEARIQRQEWTVDEAINWATEQLEVDIGSMRELLSRRVIRCALNPGVHTAALMGKIEIGLLQEAVRGAEGDNFSLADFHDRLLAQGAVPPTLLWDYFGLER